MLGVKSSPRSANFGRQHLKNLERKLRAGLHQRGEVPLGDEQYLGAAMRARGQRVGLVSNNAGQSEHRSGASLEPENWFVGDGVHCERHHTLMNYEDSRCCITLAKEHPICIARDRRRPRFKCGDEFGIGEERGSVELHGSIHGKRDKRLGS